MRVAVAADHAGFSLKNHLKRVIEARRDSVVDVGAHEFQPADDYPDFAERAGRAIIDETAERAVLICGSGVGASIAANKLPGVRAGLCHDGYSAHQGVEHDDMNVLVLGSRIVGEALAEELVAAFLNAKFSGEDRHVRRLQKVLAIENATQAR